VKSLLESDAVSGGTGGFAVSEDAAGLHVAARSFRDASGRTQKLTPIVDGKITLKAQAQPALAVLEEICKQLSPDGAPALHLGTIPLNFMGNSLAAVDANNEAAREALESLAKQVGAPVSWQMFCDPGDGGCALNLHVVR
jgi:hypothetical protein